MAKDKPSNNIVALEKLANAYAIGRDTHVGDTIIGIKGRVGFEAAAPHHQSAPFIEKHTLGNGNNIERTTRKLVRNVIS
jgi:argininosuccinate synthase